MFKSEYLHTSLSHSSLSLQLVAADHRNCWEWRLGRERSSEAKKTNLCKTAALNTYTSKISPLLNSLLHLNPCTAIKTPLIFSLHTSSDSAWDYTQRKHTAPCHQRADPGGLSKAREAVQCFFAEPPSSDARGQTPFGSVPSCEGPN